MSCGFCFGMGLENCTFISGCWNRPPKKEEKEEENLLLASILSVIKK